MTDHPDRPAAATDRSPRTSRRTIALGVLVTAGVVAVVLTHRTTVDAGARALWGADRAWLALAITGAAGLWVAGTVSQLGAIPVRPSLRLLFGVQMAASFANQLLPGGLGGMAVNLRFLRRLGLSRPTAVGAVGLNSLATGITHGLLLAAVLLAAPGVIGSWAGSLTGTGGLLPGRPVVEAVAAGLAVALLAAVAVVLVRRRARARAGAAPAGHALGQTLRRELAQLARVLRDPRRAVELWGGAASAGLLHGLILVAVLRSLGGSVPVLSAVAVYLAASAVATLIPAPGAVGPLDLLLVAGLISLGASSPMAVAAVLGYRLVTVWLPVVPSALVFVHLMRRRLL